MRSRRRPPMREPSVISWLPTWTDAAQVAELALATPTRSGAAWRCERPTHGAGIGAGLREAQRRLALMPVRAIASAIDEVARRWSDRGFAPRREACEQVVRSTGFSLEAVERSFDVELRNYRMPSL